MKTHPTQWLNAYHDGELSSEQFQVVQKHLETCSDCQEQLSQIAHISQWLQTVPKATHRQPADVFVGQVIARLPAKTPKTIQQTWRVYWLMTPVLLVGGWAFMQALIFISGLLLQFDINQVFSQVEIGSRTFLQEFFTLIVLPGPYTWLSGVITLLPGSNALHLTLLHFLVSSICSILLASWLASWFMYNRHISITTLENIYAS